MKENKMITDLAIKTKIINELPQHKRGLNGLIRTIDDRIMETRVQIGHPQSEITNLDAKSKQSLYHPDNVNSIFINIDGELIEFEKKSSIKVEDLKIKKDKRYEKHEQKLKNLNMDAVDYFSLHKMIDEAYNKSLVTGQSMLLEIGAGEKSQNDEIPQDLMDRLQKQGGALAGQEENPFKVINPEKISVSMDDVAGMEEVKEEIDTILDTIKNPDKYRKTGAETPAGAILYGPPGTGKTYLTKAIAKEANIPFIYASGSDFVEKYVGVGAKRVRELYSLARENSPCIVFIDEIDAVGSKRGGENAGEKDRTINALLTELEGFNEDAGIFTIFATNMLDSLDNALIRSGRIDKQISIPIPNLEERVAILNVHSKNKPLSEDVSLEGIAEEIAGFTGADIKSILNEAALITARRDKKEISSQEIDEALLKVILKGNLRKKGHKSSFNKKITAYHEAGHVLTRKLLSDKKVPKVTIIPSTSGSGGVTLTPTDDTKYKTKEDITNTIATLYSGRIAEELLLKDNKNQITMGASQDINVASRELETLLDYFDEENELFIPSNNSINKTDREKKAKAKAKVIYNQTKEVIEQNSDLLVALAEELMKKETLREKDIDKILEGKINTVKLA